MDQILVIGHCIVACCVVTRAWTGLVRMYHLAQKKKAFTWVTDEDSRRRQCTVRWYKRRIFGLTHHWALTFDWGDYSATYEGVEEDGFLIPKWNKGGPEHSSCAKKCGENCMWEMEKSYKVTCSPKEVNEKAFNVSYNGAKYILIMINCHLWVTMLAQSFGIWRFAIGPGEEWIPLPAAMTVGGVNSVRCSIKNF